MGSTVPPNISRGDVVKRLNKARKVLEASKESGKLMVATMEPEEGGAMPFLVISSRQNPDPFLRDACAVRLNVAVNNDDALVASMFASNSRHLVKEDELDESLLSKDLEPFIQNLIGKRYSSCQGYDFEAEYEVFVRIRKTDLPNLLIERYDGNVVFRARECSYVVESDERQCEACKGLYADLDQKYCMGRKTAATYVEAEAEDDDFEPPSIKVELHEESLMDHGTKSRAGRKRKKPKPFDEIYHGPKRANKSEGDGAGPAAAAVVRDDEEEEVAMQDDPSDADYGSKHSPRKSVRHRKAARKLIMQHLMKRSKRGRPPNIMEPTKCKDCGKTFVIAKEYKEHCVSLFTAAKPAVLRSNCRVFFFPQRYIYFFGPMLLQWYRYQPQKLGPVGNLGR